MPATTPLNLELRPPTEGLNWPGGQASAAWILSELLEFPHKSTGTY